MQIEVLVSGLIGALAATVLSVLYHYITEQVRYRREIMLEVVDWSDYVYSRMGEMQVEKDSAYTGKKGLLTADEYKAISFDLKRKLTSSKISALTALAYGEGEEVRSINSFQGELLNILSSLYTANQDKWSEEKKRIDEQFKNVIEPLRVSIHRELLLRTKVASIIKDFFRFNKRV